ncbi:hypothetical protein NMY22_g11470 [Coprinellus aureogranulatus]|nr:hypothetical protein NMY22_g11470 [Coprinellus aureogranulatus]
MSHPSYEAPRQKTASRRPSGGTFFYNAHKFHHDELDINYQGDPNAGDETANYFSGAHHFSGGKVRITHIAGGGQQSSKPMANDARPNTRNRAQTCDPSHNLPMTLPVADRNRARLAALGGYLRGSNARQPIARHATFGPGVTFAEPEDSEGIYDQSIRGGDRGGSSSSPGTMSPIPVSPTDSEASDGPDELHECEVKSYGDNRALREALKVFRPRLLEWVGAQLPSTLPTDDDIITLWEKAVGKFSSQEWTQSFDIIQEFVEEEIENWRQRFAKQAVEFFDSCWSKPGANSVEARQRWVAEMNPEGEVYPPFYYREYRREDVESNRRAVKNGLFQSPLIVSVFSIHMEEISSIPEEARSAEFPVGALALSIHACKAALNASNTGKKGSLHQSRREEMETEALFHRIKRMVPGTKWEKIERKILAAVTECIQRRRMAAEASDASEIVDGDSD